MSLSTVIVTHGDPDGMVSAILLLRLHPEAALEFDNDRTLARRLRDLAAAEPPPGAVFISDIPLGSDQHEPVRTALEALTARGTAVHLFDHHRGWRDRPEVLRLLARACVTDDDGGTAAALIKVALLPGDAMAGFWLSVLSNRERSPQTATHFALLTALRQRENYGRNKGILRALAQDATIRPEWAALAEEHRACEERALAEALAASETLTTTQGRRVGWLDRRDHRTRIFVGDRPMQAQRWDLVATVEVRKVRLGGPHINQGVSLGFLHGTHDVSGVSLQVAGHDSPVAITPLGRGGSADNFLRAVRQLIVEKL